MSSSEKSACCTATRPATPSIEEGRTPAPAGRANGSTKGMVRLQGGEFLMGADDGLGFPADGEGPVQKVRLDPFLIDACAVTNSQFTKFVRATGYQTEAERFGWSFVFRGFLPPRLARRVTQVVEEAPWWCPVEGAYWRRPEGPGSNVKGRTDHPVVHLSWNDATAYCEWAGKRLATEAEREFAARGGLEGQTYPWGNELTPGGEHRCNIWQGTFPDKNSGEDGYLGTAPVRSYEPNGFGLYNVSGNVWEWCFDWFSPAARLDGPQENPKGPPDGHTKSIRGGSYLCHDSYCNRYRVAARSSNTPDSSTGNLGFRCARDA